MRIIDLSIPIDERVPAYPGDPSVEIRQIAHIANSGWNEKRLTINTHSATHIDAPSHMLFDGCSIDEYPIEKFAGKGMLINATGTKKLEKHLVKDKELHGKIVLFMTGHSKEIHGNYFQNAPEMTMELAQEIVKKGASMVGIDFASPDSKPFDVHKLLLKNHILIIENLVNLENIKSEEFTVMALPLNIKNADGAPCRVVAIEAA